MVKKKVYVEYDDGTEMSQSRTHPGQQSPLLRDADRNLAGHVRISEIGDEDEEYDFVDYSADNDSEGERDDELAEVIGQLLGVLVIAIANSPQVKRWWDEHALPAIRSTKESAQSKLPKLRKSKRRSSSSELVPAEPSAISLSPESYDVVEQRPRLSSDEAQQRLLAALAARAFSDEQLRLLLRAEIDEPEPGTDLRRALEDSVPAEMEEQVTLMLEANPGLLDEFVQVFMKARPGDERALAPRDARGLIALRPAGSDD